jgi:large subunit ribosomal protein L29
MKNSEIKALSVEAINEQLAAEKDQLAKLEMAHAISPIENPMRIRQSRRMIARMKTILTEKNNQ